METISKNLLDKLWVLSLQNEERATCARNAQPAPLTLCSVAELRAGVKAAEAHGRALRAHYRSLRGNERTKAWRAVQAHSRERMRPLLLAYAFARGVPYRVVERVSHSSSPSLAYAIAERLLFGDTEIPYDNRTRIFGRVLEQWFTDPQPTKQEEPSCASSASTSL